ncbi:MAG: caspase family protein [Arenicellales bacterium]
MYSISSTGASRRVLRLAVGGLVLGVFAGTGNPASADSEHGINFNRSAANFYLHDFCEGRNPSDSCALAVAEDGYYGIANGPILVGVKKEALSVCKGVSTQPETCTIVDQNGTSSFIASVSATVDDSSPPSDSDFDAKLKAALADAVATVTGSVEALTTETADDGADLLSFLASNQPSAEGLAGLEKECFNDFHRSGGKKWKNAVLADNDSGIDIYRCRSFVSSDFLTWIGSDKDSSQPMAAPDSTETPVETLALEGDPVHSDVAVASQEELLGIWESKDNCVLHIYPLDDHQVIGAAWGRSKESAELLINFLSDRRFPWRRQNKNWGMPEQGLLSPSREGRFIVDLYDRDVLYSDVSPCYAPKGVAIEWRRVAPEKTASVQPPQWHNDDFARVVDGDQQPEQATELAAAASLTPATTVTPETLGVTSEAVSKSIELEFWQAISESNDVAMYEEYLRAFPAGTFAGLARLRIKSLGGTDAIAQSPAIPNLDYGNYYALVIGNNSYKDFPSLRAAINDANEISNTLRKGYGFDVELLENAGRADILRSLKGLREKVGPRDNVLIYYAGHGWLDTVADEGYWLPVDAERDDDSNWLATDRVVSQIKAMKAKHVMVVADSCFSGTITRGISIEQKDPEWFSQIVNKKARTALTSGGLEPVLDSGSNGHSAFAHAFITLLEENQGVIDGSQLFGKLRPKVMVNTTQTPQYGKIHMAGDDGGDFLFVRRQ